MSEKFQQSRSVRYGIAGAAVTTLIAASFIPFTSANAQVPQNQSTVASQTGQSITLPEGLQPAHDDVYWEDSDACASFSFDALNAVYTNDSSPVIGCSEGYVAFLNKSVEYYLQLPDAQKDGDYSSVHFALWDGQSWTMNAGIGTAYTYPDMRRFVNDPALSSEEQMEQQLMNANVWATEIHKLMGPNVAEWTSQSPASSWNYSFIGNTALQGELRDDWTVSAQDFGHGHSWNYVLDEFGGYHMSVESVASTVAPDRQCYEREATYRIEKSERISLKDDGQSLSIALLSVKDPVWGNFNRVAIVPTKAARAGEYCSLPRWYQVAENQYVGQFIQANIVLESKREIASFTNSQGWKDTVRFAQSLQSS